MKHGDEVWVKGVWNTRWEGPTIVIKTGDKSTRYVNPVDGEWVPTLKEALTAPDSPLLDQLTAEADLREREADDREFRDRCAVAAMQSMLDEACSYADVAERSYDMAEVMVAERRRRDGRD